MSESTSPSNSDVLNSNLTNSVASHSDVLNSVESGSFETADSQRTFLRQKNLLALFVVALFLSTTVCAYLVGRNQSLSSQLTQSAPSATGSVFGDGHPHVTIGGQPYPMVDATAAVVGKKYSLATGPVTDGVEGLFMLDHNSGLLQCQVIYPRTGRIGAQFSINAAEALGAGGKGGSYLMLTGRVDFPRASNRPAASVVVYVMDTATGNYVCYGVPFNSVSVNANRPQQGNMILVASGSANPIIDRDRLR